MSAERVQAVNATNLAINGVLHLGALIGWHTAKYLESIKNKESILASQNRLVWVMNEEHPLTLQTLGNFLIFLQFQIFDPKDSVLYTRQYLQSKHYYDYEMWVITCNGIHTFSFLRATRGIIQQLHRK